MNDFMVGIEIPKIDNKLPIYDLAGVAKTLSLS